MQAIFTGFFQGFQIPKIKRKFIRIQEAHGAGKSFPAGLGGLSLPYKQPAEDGNHGEGMDGRKSTSIRMGLNFVAGLREPPPTQWQHN